MIALSVGLFCSLRWTWLIALIIMSVVFGVLAKYADKIVLIILQARYMTDDGRLINQIKNLSLHLKIDSVKIYKTARYANNIYYTDSFLGTPSIVIGKNLIDKLSPNEVVCLINACLIKVKTGMAGQVTLANLLFALNLLPIFILYKFLKTTRLKNALDFLVYPAYRIQTLFEGKAEDQIQFDSLVSEMQSLKKDYLAALFKVSSLEMLHLEEISTFIINDLTLVHNRPSDALASLIYNDEILKVRLEQLK